MKQLQQRPKYLYLLLLVFPLIISSCKENDLTPSKTLDAGSDKASIKKNEEVVFTDKSTQVQSRLWTFPGGDPSTSSSSIQKVKFIEAGKHEATLKITFLDGTIETKTITIDVAPIPELSAESDNASVLIGGTVTFTDNSTLVKSRLWTFTGGTPASSTAKIAAVTYATAGKKTASLLVTFEDGTTAQKDFEITVTAAPDKVVVTGKTFIIYSELASLPQPVYTPNLAWGASGRAVAEEVSVNAYEGTKALKFALDPAVLPTNTYAMVETRNILATNITDFRTGYLNMAVRSSSKDPLRIRIQSNSPSVQAYVTSSDGGTNAWDFPRDGKWHFISIPMSAFYAAGNGGTPLTATQTTNLLTNFKELRLRTNDFTLAQVPVGYEFYSDLIFFSENKPTVNP